MENAFPKRKEDLLIVDQQLSEDYFFVVVDGENNAYYSFPEIEFSIFWSLDGKTSLPEVKEKVEKYFSDIEIPLDYLETFVEDLKEKGLLEGQKPQTAKPGIWRSLFYLRLFSINPDRLLEKLVLPLSFLFSQGFVLTGAFLIAWSVGFSLLHKAEWLIGAKGLFHGFGLLVLYLSFLIVAFVHEMGHALTCRYYGGQVKEMGFMLIYFEPAFYANVSDAYVFREKRHKMYVGLAGLYFQFLFGALVSVIWYLSIPGSLLSYFCIAMMGMNGFTALWNLNPLIKLDGYYVLSDFLEVVNLRARSFRYFGLLLQKEILGFSEIKEELKAVSGRLSKIYFTYGLFGISYTTMLLSFLFYFLFQFLTRKLAGVGLLILLGGIGWMVWNWYKNAASELARIARKVRESPDLQLDLKTRAGKIAAIAAVIFVLGLIPSHQGLKGPCVVLPAIKKVLSPLEKGVISRVYKKEGDSIKKGEIFAKLDDFEIRRELSSLRIEESLGKEHLALLKAEYGSQLTLAKGEYGQAQIALRAHELLSPETLEQARNSMEEARARYLKALELYKRLHGELLSLQKGVSPEAIAEIQEELKKASLKLEMARKDWERYQALGKENLVSPRKIEEKKSDYEAASSQVLQTKDKLALAKRDLIQNEKGAYQDYRASLKAYLSSKENFEQISKKVSQIEPARLRQDLSKTRENFLYTSGKSVQVQEAFYQLAEVQSRIKTDEERLSRMQIRSPIGGVIMTPHVAQTEGRMYGKGEPVAWVYEKGPMIFEIRMDELDISEVPVPQGDGTGNDVAVKLLALPGKSFKGKVLRIIPESLTTPNGKAYLVDVEVSDENGRLLPGMEGTGKIYGKRRPVLWQLVRRPVKYVFWKLWGLF